MNIEEFFLWCVVMLPILITPGPANIAIAGCAAATGFRSAMRFASGIMVINVLAVLLMGFGMGVLYSRYHTIFLVLQKLGALYIIYLGYLIFRSSPKKVGRDDGAQALQFRDGVILQVLNAKMYPALTMMYSQFIDGDTASPTSEVLVLSAVFLIAVTLTYLMWAWFGTVLGGATGRSARWVQQYGFGALLILVGLGLLVY